MTIGNTSGNQCNYLVYATGLHSTSFFFFFVFFFFTSAFSLTHHYSCYSLSFTWFLKKSTLQFPKWTESTGENSTGRWVDEYCNQFTLRFTIGHPLKVNLIQQMPPRPLHRSWYSGTCRFDFDMVNCISSSYSLIHWPGRYGGAFYRVKNYHQIINSKLSK